MMLLILLLPNKNSLSNETSKWHHDIILNIMIIETMPEHEGLENKIFLKKIRGKKSTYYGEK